MGKYLRKSKTSGEVSLMEVAQSSLGVRTRAKTLALQRLQKSPSLSAAANDSGGGGYQLRSRRLDKPPISVSKRQKQSPKGNCVPNPNPSLRASSRLRAGSVNSSPVESASQGVCLETEKVVAAEELNLEKKSKYGDDEGVEASFGENVVESEGRERSTRESTPCSLIRDSESIRTPGSTTRPTSAIEADRRLQNSMPRHVPTAREMDDFFTGAEEQQQKQFVEKYNFDLVNDKPLPGRYEWTKLDP
ncbi:cyclin-dependent kinase inhibitor family protein [Actinidia rufa]|uniref:Cyclin-dependent kinase inhibitor family protein n=1 Tax=Actinidia rufa TaxID=165716 RepID=A0A7J0E5G1_9ERIC|nr:cyclin-dependent kinase inhibitor family protein [Actinidia rufa]